MIITIARECGCYGDLIGEKLGEKLGIPVYDKKSVTQMAKEAGIYSKYPNFFSEKQANEFLAAIISDECETVKDTPQKALSAVIKDESFLLIGRCGNFAYGTDHNVLRIFLSGNRQIRVGNIMKKHNVNVREAEIRLIRQMREEQHIISIIQMRHGDMRAIMICVLMHADLE